VKERSDDMSTTSIREQVIEEIRRIPENKLQILLELIRDYKKGEVSSVRTERSIADFAGIWKDISIEDYNGFVQEIERRRKRTTRRRDV